jgi:hypothetical protein
MTDGGRLSVSEERLKLLFAEFKLDLFKELATYARVVDVEKWRDELNTRVRLLEDNQTGTLAVSRNKQRVMNVVYGLAFSTIGALVALVVSGVH